MAVGVSVGGDFDVHFVEAAFLVNACYQTKITNIFDYNANMK